MMRFVLLLALLGACTDVYEYDGVTAGETDDNARPSRGKTSTQFLRAIYADLLGRSPESYELVLKFNGTEFARFPADEEVLLTASLDGLGDSLPMRNLMTIAILHSAEMNLPAKTQVDDPREYIRDQFRRLLGREPNTYELEAFYGEWDSDPAVGPRAVIRAIVASREYQSQ